MQPKSFLQYDGQALTQDQFNTAAKGAARADDMVFAELLRMTPWDGVSAYSKAIIPAGQSGRIANNNGEMAPAVVWGGQATVPPATSLTGGVKVLPFRAIVGTRSTVATSPDDYWRDIRSAVFIPTTQEFNNFTFQYVSLGANASGNTRWDLIYAIVTIDAGTLTTRKVKDTTTGVVTGRAVTPIVSTTVTIGTVVGTPNAFINLPSLPADSSTVVNIPLAYVRVPNGFTSGSTVAPDDVLEVAPVQVLSTVSGAHTIRPANRPALVGAHVSAMNGAKTQGWTNTSSRGAMWMPPSMVGGETLLIPIELGNSTNWSENSLGQIDNTRDWRFRMFKWQAAIVHGAAANGLPWNFPGTQYLFPGFNPNTPGLVGTGAGNPELQIGFGSSFYYDSTGAQTSASYPVVLNGGHANLSYYPVNCQTFVSLLSGMTLFVDTSGNLCVWHNNTPSGCMVFIWLEASAQFSGR